MYNYSVLLFAGTSEGRKIAEYLDEHKIRSKVCVVSDYGEQLLPKGESLTISVGALTREEMEKEMEQIPSSGLVIDATHPYADLATDNIAEAARNTERKYCRVLRETAVDAVSDKEDDGLTLCFVKDTEEAVKKLAETTGNILVTTGSKEIGSFIELPDYKERLYVRILPQPEAVTLCTELGFTGKHLICMQGPFLKETNIAMIRQTEAKWMVTKESGKAGGFPEKCQAAREAGCGLIVIGRPMEEDGISLVQTIDLLRRMFPDETAKPKEIKWHDETAGAGQVTLVGIGMGTEGTLTCEAARVIGEADVLIGASRMVEPYKNTGKEIYVSYQPDEICGFVRRLPSQKKVAILLSGDLGFYSGAKQLINRLPEKPDIVCGISSMIYFCSRLGTDWEDIYPVSVHGKTCNIIGLLREYPRIFALAGTKDNVAKMCQQLAEYGMGEVTVSIGERLSYPDEKITVKKAKELVDVETDSLCVILLENTDGEKRIVTSGIADSEFIRGEVPMTKEEVRSISISKLHLTKDAVIYDVGAGTGSVAVEMARLAYEGHVYAVEQNPEAVELIKENQKKFALDNLSVIQGTAPMAISDLPDPDYAFVGGSSGNLKEIMHCLIGKNPRIRVVVNAISLETMAEAIKCIRELAFEEPEIISVNIAKAKKAGKHHLMMGQNPVYVICAQGKEN